MSTVIRRLVSGFALLTLLLLTAVPADAATLGRGMDQLVRLHETNNPKLAAALNAHLRNSTGAVLVHVRLDPDASSAQVLEALRRARLRPAGDQPARSDPRRRLPAALGRPCRRRRPRRATRPRRSAAARLRRPRPEPGGRRSESRRGPRTRDRRQGHASGPPLGQLQLLQARRPPPRRGGRRRDW